MLLRGFWIDFLTRGLTQLSLIVIRTYCWQARKRSKEVKAFKEVAHLNARKASNALSDRLNETAAALLAQYKGNLAKFRKEAVELGVAIAGRSAKQIAKSVAEIMLQPPHQE